MSSLRVERELLGVGADRRAAVVEVGAAPVMEIRSPRIGSPSASRSAAPWATRQYRQPVGGADDDRDHLAVGGVEMLGRLVQLRGSARTRR